jgi:hypothetical protein
MADDIEEFRLSKDLKLYNFNIDRTQPSREVQRKNWVDGERVTETIRVYGEPDDIDNRFPYSAEPEPEGDPDADTPIPAPSESLIPTEIVEKAKSLISGIGEAVDTTVESADKVVKDLQGASDIKEIMDEAANNLEALLAEAKRVLELDDGVTEEDAKKSFAAPDPSDITTLNVPTQERRLQDNGQTVNFNIDRKQPYRDVDVGGVKTRVYASQEILDQYYPQESRFT